MIVKPIKLGVYQVDSNKNFKLIEEKSENGISMAIQPFYVETEHEKILIDGGIGALVGENTLLPDVLMNNNIDPKSISCVLLSHLHKDHTDGLGYFEGGNYIQHFVNATIYIHYKELQKAKQQTESLSYDQAVLKALENLPNVVFLHENEGQLSSTIYYKLTSGHTEYHQVFWIRENNSTVFYGGDNLPTTGYLRKPIAFKTDFDGKLAREWRKIWQDTAMKENWQVLFYHDIFTTNTIF